MVIVLRQGVGMSDLLAALRFCYPFDGFRWATRHLGFNWYLVLRQEGWWDEILKKGIIDFGTFKFTVLSFVPEVHPIFDPVQCWVRVSGLPYHMRTPSELASIISKFDKLLTCDINTLYRVDLQWARVSN
jgi:Domain of unknown function (DUF4283)